MGGYLEGVSVWNSGEVKGGGGMGGGGSYVQL